MAAVKKVDEDLISEASALAEAAPRLEKFALDHSSALWGLVMTYSDDEASALLVALRDKFWSES